MVERGLRGGGGLGRPRRALTALALSLLAAGCYAYTEVSPAAVPPGSTVRVRVEPGARVDGGSGPLEEGTRLLEGRLMEGNSAETLRLSMVLRRDDPSLSTRALRSTVTVPMADVQSVELRKLDRKRTGLTIAGSSLVALGVLQWALNVLDPAGDGPDGGGGGVDNARWVLFRLRW